ncbi:hypothetical protein RYX36_012660 [Vicia faba]
MFRDGKKTGFNALQIARKKYKVSCGVGGINCDLVWRYMDVQTRLLAPICPYYAEFIGREILKKDGFMVKAGWPTTDELQSVVRHVKRDVKRATSRILNEGEHGHSKVKERQRILLLASNLLGKHNNELATLETWDNGKPYEQADEIEVPMLTRLIL